MRSYTKCLAPYWRFIEETGWQGLSGSPPSTSIFNLSSLSNCERIALDLPGILAMTLTIYPMPEGDNTVTCRVAGLPQISRS